MAKKHTKTCLPSLAIKEIQIKTTLKLAKMLCLSYYLLCFLFFFFLLFFSFIHMCIQCLGHFSPLPPPPTLPTYPLLCPLLHSCYQAETILPLSLILLKREYNQ
jgi:hypothetical protein